MTGPQAVMLNGRCADRSGYNKDAYPSPCNAGYRGIALSTDGGVTFGQTMYVTAGPALLPHRYLVESRAMMRVPRLPP